MAAIATDQEHEQALARIDVLIKDDPARGTPEGDELAGLAAAVEEYEMARYGGPMSALGEEIEIFGLAGLMEPPELEVEIVGIDTLVPDAKNPRRHGARNHGMIVDSLNEVGPARSIVIDENNVVLCGNETRKAAEEVGISNVKIVDATPDTLVAVRVTGLNEQQKRRLAYYDNQSGALADWEPEQVRQDQEEGLLAGILEQDETDAILAELDEEKAAEKKQAPQLEISPEMHERQDYLLIYFDNGFDWQAACDALGVTQVYSAPVGKKTIRQKGLARVIPASRLLDLLGLGQ